MERRTGMVVIALVVLAALLVALIVWLTPWTVLPTPAGGRTPPDPARDFTPAELARAKAYVHAILPGTIGSLLVGLVVAGVLGLTGLGTRLVGWAGGLAGGGWWAQVLLGSVALALVARLCTLPFSAYAFVVRRRYGLSTQDWSSYAVDLLKGLAIDTVMTTVALVVFYAVARAAPKTWWVWVSGLAVIATIAVTFLWPVLIEPVFNRFTSMPDGPLRTSLLVMAERDGVPVSDVLVADASRRTTALNAYVSGFGPTRRIVVYDTLLTSAPDREVELVVAHELGHASNNDVLTFTAVGAVGAATGVCALFLVTSWAPLLRRAGVSAISDPRSMALVILLVTAGGLVATPLMSVVSRRIEARADVHALELTGDPATFRAMQVRIARTNLADPDPNPVLYAVFATHPSTAERIALARDWAKLHGVAVP